MADHADRMEELEKQRLEIEQQRLRWQKKQEQLKGEKERDLREMRKFLSQIITRVASLRNAPPTNRLMAQDTATAEIDMPLTIRLAVLQSAGTFLTERDVFDDLGDMQALAQCRTGLDEFIASVSQSGHTNANPLGFVRQAIAFRVGVLSEMAAFMSQCRQPTATLATKPLYAFSETEIASIQADAQNLLAGMTDGFSQYAESLDNAAPPLGVDLYSTDLQALNGISGDLEQFHAILSAEEATEQDFVECVNGQGAKYEALAHSLKSAL